MRELSWIEKKNDKGYIGLVNVSYFEEHAIILRYENVCMLFSTNIITSYIITSLYLFAFSNQSCRHIATRCQAVLFN